VTSCLTGFGDCNDSGNDGCETPIKTAANCGSCGNDCGTATCNAGGFCNALEIGANYYAGRALFAGTSVYRLSVPANNYNLQPSYSLVRTPVDGSADVIMDAQNKAIGGMVADAPTCIGALAAPPRACSKSSRSRLTATFSEARATV